MDMIKALNIDINKRHLISIVGAGGKTTLLYNLSEELKQFNKKILISTTTHIYIPPKEINNDLIISKDRKALLRYVEAIRDKGIYVMGKEITNENKIKGIDIHLADELYNTGVFDFMLFEADGGKKKPIKAPAEWEPAVPQSTTVLIGVIGLDSLGRAAGEETVHRPDEFCIICGCRPGDKIDTIMLAKLIRHPQGLFKNAPDNANKIVLLNKADNSGLREAGLKIKSMAEDENIGFVIASLRNKMYWM